MGKGGSGCAAVIGIIFIIAAVVWAAAIAVWLLGGLLVLGSVVMAIAGIVYAWFGVAHKKSLSSCLCVGLSGKCFIGSL